MLSAKQSVAKLRGAEIELATQTVAGEQLALSTAADVKHRCAGATERLVRPSGRAEVVAARERFSTHGDESPRVACALV